MFRFFYLLLIPVVLFSQESYRSWSLTGGNADNNHYSSLDQINRENVSKLRIAWQFDSGDSYQGSDVQCNPIVVDGVMYVTTAKLRVVALEADTGKRLWSFDGVEGDRSPHQNRGVTYWTDGHKRRIYVTIRQDLISLDAATGKLDADFGTNGKVDLRLAYDPPVKDTSLSVTSPGVIYKDLIILGSSVSETLPATPGDIRAYDVQTGKLRWTFHTIPHPGEFGYETWPPNAWKTSGAANNWAGSVVDVKRGLVFVPTGSTAYDFYGADRIGDDLFANTLICLDAATGKRKWHFQAVRHDVWDLDFPAPPLLMQCVHEGKLVDAVAQPGKSGFLYVLNRETGESLFPLEERSVPTTTVDGEVLAKTEPVPTKPEPFVRQNFTDDTVTRRNPAAHEAVMKQLKDLDHGALFIPPSLRGMVAFPGPAGGAEWGGGSYDPQTHLYYLNANESSWIVRLAPQEGLERTAPASAVYRSRCAGCHGADRKGAPPEYPSLDKLEGRITAQQVSTILHNGGGRMPTFVSLGEPAIAGLVDYLMNGVDRELPVKGRRNSGLKYGTKTFKTFVDPDGYPANTPPWGTLSAINLDTGNYAWKIPLGEYPELAAAGIRDTGTENHGGSAVTAGGLLFIGATHYDNKFRALDKKTGQLIWETKLPFAANATPSVYEVNGKEYIVVAAGGGRERPSGGLFIAFTLP